MAGFNRRSDSSGEKRFSKFNARPRRERADGPSRFGDRDRRNAMHTVVCDTCGEKCEVPFKPNGSKPVQCRNCFRKASHGANASDSSSRDSGSSAPSISPAELKEIHAKLDKIIKFLKIE